ncbi:MAG: tyrosine-type recombinase/integrase [Bdellovibrionales bacterium]|nr:tyrosine-type recombinase/integrase [Bdellovibrionales bacterium]
MALDFWVEFFEDLQHVRGRSLNTVMAYRRDLELYEEFRQRHSDISRLYEFMSRRGLSPRSQARVVSSLRTYFRFCEKREMKVPELRGLRPPKVKVGLPRVLKADDFRRLYQACEVENSFRTGRNQITLLLLFGLGCRVSELIGLNLVDINSTDAWVKVVGKGGKERLIPLTVRLMKELDDYLLHVRPVLIKGKHNAVLVNDRGHRPSRVDIWRWLSAWSEKAGFSEPMGPHRFRHGCATALLESGADLRSIQMLLGHSSIQTTQIYTTVSKRKIRDEVDRVHPLSEPPKRDSQ